MTTDQRKEITDTLRRVIDLVDRMSNGTEILAEHPVESMQKKGLNGTEKNRMIDAFVREMYKNIMTEFGKDPSKDGGDQDLADYRLRKINRFEDNRERNPAIKRIRESMCAEFKRIKLILLEEGTLSAFEDLYLSRIEDFIKTKYTVLRLITQDGLTEDRIQLSAMFHLINGNGPMILIKRTITAFFLSFFDRHNQFRKSKKPQFSEDDVAIYNSMLKNAESSGTLDFPTECIEILKSDYTDHLFMFLEAFQNLCERAVMVGHVPNPNPWQ